MSVIGRGRVPGTDTHPVNAGDCSGPVPRAMSLEDRPYLSWVTEADRALVIDPASLPRYTNPARLCILFLTETLTSGGAERLVVNAAKHLVAAGHRVFVRASRLNGAGFFGNFHGATLVDADEDIAEVARREGIQIAVSSNGGGLDLAPTLAKCGVKVVVVPYGMTSWNLQMLQAHEGALEAVSAFMAYPSVGGAMRHDGFTNKPVYAYRGLVDPDEFPFCPHDPKPPYHIAYVGRISWEKNLCGMLRVIRRMAERVPVVFDLIGGVDPTAPVDYQEHYRKNLEILHADPLYSVLKDAGILVEHGLLLPHELRIAYEKADAMLLTSDFEGEPVCFLEGFAAGVLCAGRATGEMSQMMADVGHAPRPTERRLSDGEVEALADGLVGILQNPDEYRRLVDNAYRKALAYYAPEPWVSDFEAICCKVIGPTLIRPETSAPSAASGSAPLLAVVDVPGWATDQIVRRVARHLPFEVKTHYLYRSKDDFGKAPHLGLPRARSTWFLSWAFMWQALIHGRLLGPHIRQERLVPTVLDEYSWRDGRSLRCFAAVRALADTFLTSTHAFASAMPDARYFCEPVPDEWITRERRPREPDGRLRVGMVANGFGHEVIDHKGARLAKRLIDTLDFCDLDIAGIDRVVPPDEMPEWYDSIDVFMSLSKSEGFGMAIADAIALGCPVIGTNVAPLCHIKEKRAYLPVSRDDPDWIVTALRKAHETLQDGGTLPTARHLAKPWRASVVAAGLVEILTGEAPEA